MPKVLFLLALEFVADGTVEGAELTQSEMRLELRSGGEGLTPLVGTLERHRANHLPGERGGTRLKELLPAHRTRLLREALAAGGTEDVVAALAFNCVLGELETDGTGKEI